MEGRETSHYAGLMLCYAIYATLRYLCYATLRYAMLMLCYAVLCYAVLCYARSAARPSTTSPRERGPSPDPNHALCRIDASSRVTTCGYRPPR